MPHAVTLIPGDGTGPELTEATRRVLADVQAGPEPVELDHLDGVTVSAVDGSWWFNLRPSNTEPLLRLNVEAPDVATMERVRDEVLGLIRG